MKYIEHFLYDDGINRHQLDSVTEETKNGIMREHEFSMSFDWPSIVINNETGETICEYRGDEVREAMKDGN